MLRYREWASALVARCTPGPWAVAVMIAAGCCLALLNTVGIPGFAVPGPGENYFGWPMSYAIAPLTATQLEQRHLFRQTHRLKLSPIELCADADSLQQFDARALLGNMAVGATIMMSVGFLVEYRRRALNQPNRYRLQSLFLLVLFVAVFAGASRSTIVATAYMGHILLWRKMTLVLVCLTILWTMWTPVRRRAGSR